MFETTDDMKRYLVMLLGSESVVREGNTMEILAAVRKGIPLEVLEELVQVDILTDEQVYDLIISRRSLAARREQKIPLLTPDESDVLYRIALVFSHAMTKFELEEAIAFLNTGNKKLGGQPPMKILDTYAGSMLIHEWLITGEAAKFSSDPDRAISIALSPS